MIILHETTMFLEARLREREVERQAEVRRQIGVAPSTRGWRWPFRRRDEIERTPDSAEGGWLGGWRRNLADRRAARQSVPRPCDELGMEATAASGGNGVIWPWLRPVSEFPTLRFIDRARGGTALPLSSAPNAELLESLARELTAAYWTDLVWQTGQISDAALRIVVEALELQRQVVPSFIGPVAESRGSAA